MANVRPPDVVEFEYAGTPATLSVHTVWSWNRARCEVREGEERCAFSLPRSEWYRITLAGHDEQSLTTRRRIRVPPSARYVSLASRRERPAVFIDGGHPPRGFSVVPMYNEDWGPTFALANDSAEWAELESVTVHELSGGADIVVPHDPRWSCGMDRDDWVVGPGMRMPLDLGPPDVVFYDDRTARRFVVSLLRTVGVSTAHASGASAGPRRGAAGFDVYERFVITYDAPAVAR